MSTRPEVSTNRKGRTVARDLAEHWQYLLDTQKEAPDLAIATAYFNPGGFSLLADQLESAGHVKLLIGAEPDVAQDLGRLRSLRGPKGNRGLGEEERERLREALREHHARMETDRDLTSFSRSADARIKRMIEWLRSERVETRRLTKRFLHAKAFIVETGQEGVLAGSSNFTYAGLANNVELNLGQYQPGVVGEVRDLYGELWEEAEEFDLAGFYEERYEKHSPWIVYLRMLYERYADELQEEREAASTGLDLTQFQSDGVYRARDYLEKNNGVLIADGVGLGKTYLAGELIRQAVQDRRQRVMLIAPAALRDGPWEQFLREQDLKGVQCISFEQLARDPRVGGEGNRVLWYDPDEYAMVAIDEAHAYRNPNTNRAATLRNLLQGSPPKKVVLLTATPVNNSLWDLYHVLSYFIRNDAAFLDAGIPSLREHFTQAQAEDPEDLSPEKLFDVLDAMAVRRTRRFVKRFYPHDRVTINGVETTLTFPQPKVHRVGYDLDEILPGFFHRFAHMLGGDPEDQSTENGGPSSNTSLPSLPSLAPEDFDPGEQLTLARYSPSAYEIGGGADAFELQAAGLLRSGLLKRFESSSYAFAQTCRKMARSHEEFLGALTEGYVLTGEALSAWTKTDSEEFELTADGNAGSTGGRHGPAKDYDQERLRAAVEADRELLIGLAEEAERVTVDNDPKLEALIDALAEIAREAKEEASDDSQERDKRKVLIFTYYADTVAWIRRGLERSWNNPADHRLEPYRDRFTTLTGSSGNSEDALFGFAPVSAQAKYEEHGGRYDLLVATDVLAEGVNLQQARHIINFDLPWNPMRLVQRHGRIDRIGSPHSTVHLRCFFPTANLDGLLGLESTLERKIAQAANTIGVEGEIVPGSKASDQVFTHNREQLDALRSEDATLFEDDVDSLSSLSGEEFRRELSRALEDPRIKSTVENLPWIAGSGKLLVSGDSESVPGFVFCARVGDHARPEYRWVPLNEDLSGVDADAVGDETLACLGKAGCSHDTERVLPDWLSDLAYDAWEVAREDIFERWEANSDYRAVQPPIPKAMRDAAELLRSHAPPDVSGERLYKLLDAIEAPYEPRTQREMRQALKAHESPAECAREVIRVAEDLGLEPPAPVEPLPEIEEQDIHLVTWMALAPANASEAEA